MKRFCAVAVVIVVLLVQGAPTHAETSQPVRSGTILFGVPVTGPQSCSYSPDCVAWLASGCDARLTGLDPAVSTSIVDVGDIAGSQRHLVVEGLFHPWLSATNFEFWSSGCQQVGRTYVRGGMNLTIPRDARWMTAPSSVGPYHWQLW